MDSPLIILLQIYIIYDLYRPICWATTVD